MKRTACVGLMVAWLLGCASNCPSCRSCRSNLANKSCEGRAREGQSGTSSPIKAGQAAYGEAGDAGLPAPLGNGSVLAPRVAITMEPDPPPPVAVLALGPCPVPRKDALAPSPFPPEPMRSLPYAALAATTTSAKPTSFGDRVTAHIVGLAQNEPLTSKLEARAPLERDRETAVVPFSLPVCVNGNADSLAAAKIDEAHNRLVDDARNHRGEGRRDRAEGNSGPTAVRFVQSKRVSLNYEVKDVGSSGIADVELWYTRDGRLWQKQGSIRQARPPYVAEVEDEDLYGFTLVVHSGMGLGKRPPQEGDAPQIWVEVDTTKPVVRLLGVEAGKDAEARQLTISWRASDKNLGPRPIAISFASQANGPWLPIATQVENSGRYAWTMPADMPHRFLVRVEATDQAGNVGVAQTQTPLLGDLSYPTAAITNAEAMGMK